MPNHLIQRLMMELSIAEPTSRVPIEAEIEFLLIHKVWPDLEQLFIQWDQPGEMLRIDRMVIDLGCIPADKLRTHWPDEFITKFAASLRLSLDHAARKDIAFRWPSWPADDDATGASPPHRSDLTGGSIEALGYYLHHGVFPWWWPIDQHDINALLGSLLAGPAMLRTHLADETVCRRLSMQLSSANMGRLLDQILHTSPAKTAFSEVHQRLLSLPPSPAKPPALMVLESLLLFEAVAASDSIEIPVDVTAFEKGGNPGWDMALPDAALEGRPGAGREPQITIESAARQIDLSGHLSPLTTALTNDVQLKDVVMLAPENQPSGHPAHEPPLPEAQPSAVRSPLEPSQAQASDVVTVDSILPASPSKDATNASAGLTMGACDGSLQRHELQVDGMACRPDSAARGFVGQQDVPAGQQPLLAGEEPALATAFKDPAPPRTQPGHLPANSKVEISPPPVTPSPDDPPQGARPNNEIIHTAGADDLPSGGEKVFKPIVASRPNGLPVRDPLSGEAGAPDGADPLLHRRADFLPVAAAAMEGAPLSLADSTSYAAQSGLTASAASPTQDDSAPAVCNTGHGPLEIPRPSSHSQAPDAIPAQVPAVGDVPASVPLAAEDPYAAVHSSFSPALAFEDEPPVQKSTPAHAAVHHDEAPPPSLLLPAISGSPSHQGKGNVLDRDSAPPGGPSPQGDSADLGRSLPDANTFERAHPSLPGLPGKIPAALLQSNARPSGAVEIHTQVGGSGPSAPLGVVSRPDLLAAPGHVSVTKPEPPGAGMDQGAVAETAAALASVPDLPLSPASEIAGAHSHIREDRPPQINELKDNIGWSGDGMAEDSTTLPGKLNKLAIHSPPELMTDIGSSEFSGVDGPAMVLSPDANNIADSGKEGGRFDPAKEKSAPSTECKEPIMRLGDDATNGMQPAVAESAPAASLSGHDLTVGLNSSAVPSGSLDSPAAAEKAKAHRLQELNRPETAMPEAEFTERRNDWVGEGSDVNPAAPLLGPSKTAAEAATEKSTKQTFAKPAAASVTTDKHPAGDPPQTKGDALDAPVSTRSPPSRTMATAFTVSASEDEVPGLATALVSAAPWSPASPQTSAADLAGHASPDSLPESKPIVRPEMAAEGELVPVQQALENGWPVHVPGPTATVTASAAEAEAEAQAQAMPAQPDELGQSHLGPAPVGGSTTTRSPSSPVTGMTGEGEKGRPDTPASLWAIPCGSHSHSTAAAASGAPVIGGSDLDEYPGAASKAAAAPVPVTVQDLALLNPSAFPDGETLPGSPGLHLQVPAPGATPGVPEPTPSSIPSASSRSPSVPLREGDTHDSPAPMIGDEADSSSPLFSSEAGPRREPASISPPPATAGVFSTSTVAGTGAGAASRASAPVVALGLPKAAEAVIPVKGARDQGVYTTRPEIRPLPPNLSIPSDPDSAANPPALTLHANAEAEAKAEAEPEPEPEANANAEAKADAKVNEEAEAAPAASTAEATAAGAGSSGPEPDPVPLTAAQIQSMELRALLHRHLAGLQVDPELRTSASALLGDPPPLTGAGAASAPAPADRSVTHPRRQRLEPAVLPPPDTLFHTGTAGLVLLWPYLRRCFTLLGLVEGDAFVSDTAAHRAVHLLHYMATGTETAPEPALLLPKILCGVPWSQPVPASVALTDQEKSEAEALLRAAIQHWPKVSNSSIGGFRSSFLIREGRLTLAQSDFGVSGWELHIERKGHDILLDYLPWTLSLIKLPWLPHFITVQW